MTNFFGAGRDRVIYEVSFSPVNEESWVFCACKRNDASYLKKSYADLVYLLI